MLCPRCDKCIAFMRRASRNTIAYSFQSQSIDEVRLEGKVVFDGKIRRFEVGKRSRLIRAKAPSTTVFQLKSISSDSTGRM